MHVYILFVTNWLNLWFPVEIQELISFHLQCMIHENEHEKWTYVITFYFFFVSATFFLIFSLESKKRRKTSTGTNNVLQNNLGFASDVCDSELNKVDLQHSLLSFIHESQQLEDLLREENKDEDFFRKQTAQASNWTLLICPTKVFFIML